MYVLMLMIMPMCLILSGTGPNSTMANVDGYSPNTDVMVGPPVQQQRPGMQTAPHRLRAASPPDEGVQDLQLHLFKKGTHGGRRKGTGKGFKKAHYKTPLPKNTPKKSPEKHDQNHFSKQNVSHYTAVATCTQVSGAGSCSSEKHSIKHLSKCKK